MVGAAAVGAGEVGMVGVAGELSETAGGMGSGVSVVPTMYVSYGSLEESKGSDSPSGISPLVLASMPNPLDNAFLSSRERHCRNSMRPSNQTDTIVSG